MLQGKRTRKSIAATFLAVMLTNILAPTVTYALTSGPTAPEATSFEPIDTTDMVNLQTGDFTYNIPLLEVPGPEGGYPLSLSYHAGIQPNEDASWVGLGWSLNPGAITRNVNGYPDDWDNPINNSHTYWIGGTTKTYSVGLSVGVANCATVGFGLSFSQDTYKGFGVGNYLSAGYGFKINELMGLGGSVTLGVTAYGDPYLSAGLGINLGLGNSKFSASLGVGFNTNFNSVSAGFSAGVGYGGQADERGNRTRQFSLLGTSMSTTGGKPALSAGGISTNVSSSNAPGIQTKSSGFGVDVPVFAGINISLGFNKVRYWTDEKIDVTTHGSIHNSGWVGEHEADNAIKANAAHDSYSLIEDPANKNIMEYGDPGKVQGGAFYDFDVYNVNAQGLSGSIRPYIFQGEALSQNKKTPSNTPSVTYYSPGVVAPQPKFRFVGDFSNSYRQSYDPYSNTSSNYRLTPPPFDATPDYGFGTGADGGVNAFSNYTLYGSKSIQVGTALGATGTNAYPATVRFRTNMIENFKIINESGITYHYSLPAYNYGEEITQSKISAPANDFNRQTKGTAYAYTWYLTSVTGPDFVDRNSNNKADADDWGYWINFEYGKWSDGYVWRNPSEGYHKDDDGEWQNVSMGKKEVYYLNAIKTRTHAALFEKDLRKDGKSAAASSFDKDVNGRAYANNGTFGVSSGQSLALSKIYLLNIADVGIVNTSSGGYFPFHSTETASGCLNCQLAQNIYDRSDFDYVGRSGIEAKAIRVIDMIYDYSLCPKTPNSFISQLPTEKFGKLTLKKLNLRGKGGVGNMPPISFDYELSGDELKSQNNVSLTSTSFTTPNDAFSMGDMIVKSDGVYCGVITQWTFNGTNYIYTLANSSYTGGAITANISTTKNPPYNKDFFDSWGLYKSDLNTTVLSADENAARQTSLVSSRGIDSWSLRKITSAMGSSIAVKYESDEYSSVAIPTNCPFTINTPTTDGPALTNTIPYEEFMWSNNFWVINGNTGYNKIKFKVNMLGLALTDFFQINGSGKMVVASGYPSPWGPTIEAIDSDYTITLIDPDGTVHVTLKNPIPTTVHPVNAAGDHLGTFTFTGITAGNISPSVNVANFNGGGIRVGQISLDDNSGNIATTLYNYNFPQNNLLSSGTTSYTPLILDVSGYSLIPGNTTSEINYEAYRKVLYKGVSSLYPIARELPSPGIMYQYVTVTNQIKNLDEATPRLLEGKTEYQFEVYRKNMVARMTSTPQTSVVLGLNQRALNVIISKFTGSLGNMKKIVQYDLYGRKLSETTNTYLHDGLENLPADDFFNQYKSRINSYKNQGFIQERVSEVKQVQNAYYPSDNGIKSTMTSKEEYPTIQIGQTVINYVNGTRTQTENLEFDFFSGALVKSLSIDAYGNRFQTIITPAYRKYSQMGIALANAGNKNMLTQVAGAYMYKVNSSNLNVGLVYANAQTWSNLVPVRDLNNVHLVQNTTTNGNVWRMESSYEWMPVNKTTDGITPVANFSDLNFIAPASSNANWQKTNQVSLYDPFSKGLEQIDMKGVRSATRFTYGNQKVTLSGANCKYFEIAFGHVEDDGINQTFNSIVKKGDGIVTSADAHTGARSLKLGVAGKKGLLYSPVTNDLTIGRDYVAMVWAKPVSGSASDVKLFYDIDGVVKGTASSAASTKIANGWTLVTLFVSGADIVANKTLTFGCRNDHATAEVYVDDIRFQPANATTMAYVYDSFSGELTYVLDNNNLYAKYDYDASGRLTAIYREKLGSGVIKTNEYVYNMGQPLLSTIYVKTVYDFVSTQTSSGCIKTHYYNVYLKFYSDAARTIPVNVSNLSFDYSRDIYSSSTGATSRTVYAVSIGSTPVNQFLIGSNIACYSTDCNGIMSSRTNYVVNYNVRLDGGSVIYPIPPPLPVLYAKMIKTYNYSTTNGCTQSFYYHIDVNFYSDAAGTIPQATNGFAIAFNENGTQYTHTLGSTPVSSVRLRSNFLLNTLYTCPYSQTPGLISLVNSAYYTIIP